MNTITSYPEHLSWDNKVFSMPNIPRGRDGMLAVLRTILSLVKAHTPPTQTLTFDGSSSRISLNDVCIRLRPMRLVIRTASGWELTPESQAWLDSNDDLYLAALLCANTKFLGEILFYLDEPKTSAQLQEIALSEYGLSWKTKSDINSRLVWLRTFGLVDFQEFSLLYSRTETGSEFLSRIHIETPVIATDFADITEAEDSLPVSEWAIDIANTPAPTRKATIGYIPGDVSQFDVTIFEYIQLIGSGKDYLKIVDFSESNFHIAKSSVKSLLNALGNMGIIQRLTDTIYSITPPAGELQAQRSTLDLLCIIHSNCKFIFEMLGVLRKEQLTNKELAARAKVSYGFERESIDEIRKRITMLKAAKLIRNAGMDRYTITARGVRLLERISISTEITPPPPINDSAAEDSRHSNALLIELRLAAKDSSNPARLEKAVQQAFELLGFQSEWLGGSGRTDVLLHTTGSPQNAYTVTVDAKSTGTGFVTDNLVDFDTIAEHKKKHNANYCAIVGGAFQNERLITRASEHGVALIDVDTLGELVAKHLGVPIGVNAYRKLFATPGVVNSVCVDDDRQAIIRSGNLLQAVMDCLTEECEDPVTHGLLQDRDIYRSLRKNELFDYPPSLDEISGMLDFLASPFIGCVEKVKDGYYSVGTLKDASQKFAYFAAMCRK